MAAVVLGAPGFAVAGSGNGFVPSQQRLFDSRTDAGGQPVSGFVQVTLPDSVPTGTTAVLTVTVTQSSGPGYVVVYPDGMNLPPTSNINLAPGQTVADAVLVPPGNNGNVDFYVSGGPTQLIVDLSGELPAASYTPLAPTRLADSRNGTGLPKGPLSGVHTITLPSSVPSTAGDIALTVTATGASSSGYITAYPGGSPRPKTSNVNFSAGTTQANLVLVPKSAGGTISFYISTPANVIVDLDGYAPAGSAVTSLPSSRLADTRTGSGLPKGPIHGSVNLTLPSSVPAGATGVLLNVTSVGGSTAGGYVTVYPAGQAQPATSNVNFNGPNAVADLVLVPVGTNNQVTLTVGGAGSTQLVVDLDGYVTS